MEAVILLAKAMGEFVILSILQRTRPGVQMFWLAGSKIWTRRKKGPYMDLPQS